jgi:cytochrome subunit of sulfide dehydrogenase
MPTLPWARWACLPVIWTLSTALVGAQTQPPAGRLLASNCFQCHGTNGKGPGFDKLAGKPAKEIVEELMEMRAGKEDKGGIMAKHAMGYTDAQLQALASYLSKQR